MNNQFEVRNAEKSDLGFVYHSWLNGLRFGSDWYGAIPEKIYYKEYQLVIDAILEKKETNIKIACLPDDLDVILGYCVYAEDKLHWVFVKDSWRKMGIAKLLVPKSIESCTHISKIGRSLAWKYKITFNPFFII